MQRSTSGELTAADFPALERGVYANHAAIAPWPRATAAAVRAFATESSSGMARCYPRWLQREKALRTLLAKMLNAASADDVALLKNTSEGVNFAAGGIGWRPGDNVVTPAGEFPTNRLAWAALEARGVQLRQVDIRSADDPERALLDAVDGRTRVLSVSSVAWQDGFRLRLPLLGAACASTETLFFVDAIQEFGALQMDVQAASIDCLAAGSHKWQLGPEGMGVFYCSPRARERLALTHFGWHMLERPYRYEPGPRPPARGARRFEAGSPNMLGQAALFASLEMLDSHGMARVEACVLENSARLRKGIEIIPGLEPVSDPRPGRISGIVNFTAPSIQPAVLLKRLREAGVEAAMRGDGIRLSPHFYQHGEPLGRLLNTLELEFNKLS